MNRRLKCQTQKQPFAPNTTHEMIHTLLGDFGVTASRQANK